ncbi:MAG: DUF4267 domain-containing protein [Streptomyces turgidiscabies]|nr:DUF4267 domain-containing protein [Streptomyces turgidiscabies]
MEAAAEPLGAPPLRPRRRHHRRLRPAGHRPHLSQPRGGGGFLIVKGIRDVVLALVLGVLLVTGNRRPLGWILLVGALAAYGDMATVLAHHGSVATALGVHGLTGTLMVVNGLLMLRETRETRETATAPAAPAPAV